MFTTTLTIKPIERTVKGNTKIDKYMAQGVCSPCQPIIDVLLNKNVTQVNSEHEPSKSLPAPTIPYIVRPACKATVAALRV